MFSCNLFVSAAVRENFDIFGDVANISDEEFPTIGENNTTQSRIIYDEEEYFLGGDSDSLDELLDQLEEKKIEKIVPEYKEVEKTFKVLLPPWNLLRPYDRNRLKGAHSSSIVGIAEEIRKDSRYKKKKFTEKIFSYKEKVQTNAREIENLARTEDIMAHSKDYKFIVDLPTNLTDDELNDFKFCNMKKIKGKVNELYDIARKRAKTDGAFKIHKVIRKFSHLELIPSKHHASPAAVSKAKQQAENLEKYAKRIDQKKKIAHSERDKARQVKVKEARENKIISLRPEKEEVKEEVVVPIRSKIRSKRQSKKMAITERKYQNMELRKFHARQKAYRKEKKSIEKDKSETSSKNKNFSESQSKEKSDVTPSTPDSFGNSKHLTSNITKESIEKRRHDHAMRLRRLKKEQHAARVKAISENRKKRREAKKLRKKSKELTFHTEAFDNISDSLESLQSPYSDAVTVKDLDEDIRTEVKHKSTYRNAEIDRISKLIDDNDPAINMIAFIANLMECTTSTQLMSASYMYLSSWGLTAVRKSAIVVSLGALSATSGVILLRAMKKWRKKEGYTAESIDEKLAYPENHKEFDPNEISEEELKELLPGFSPSRIFDTILSWGGRFFTSAVYQALKKFVLSLVSFGLFEREDSKIITKLIGKPVKRSMAIVDVCQDILNATSQLLRSGEMIVRGFPLESCFFAKDLLTVHIAKSKAWVENLPLVVQGIPPPGKIHIKRHVKEGKEIREFLKVACKKLNPLGGNYEAAMAALRRMEIALPMLQSQLQSRTRPTPLAICIVGPPGIGKSTIITMIAYIFCLMTGRPWTPEMIFHRTPSDDFWENFNPEIHHILHLSEIGSKSDKVMEKGDPAIAELTSVIDSQPYAVPMAFDQKGKVFCLAELVIIDTNEEDMGLHIIQKNPAAFQRRFLYLFPHVKEEYRKDNSFMLDATKGDPSDYLDKWTFKAVRKVPTLGGGPGKKKHAIQCNDVTVFEAQNVKEFTNMLSSYMRDYMTKEANVQKQVHEQLPFLAKHMSVPEEMQREEKLELNENDEKQFSSEARNIFNDLVEYALYKSAEPRCYEVILASIDIKMREKAVFMKELSKRYVEAGSTLVEVSVPLTLSLCKTIFLGCDLYIHRKNYMEIFNPWMWTIIIMALSATLITMDCRYLLLLLAIMLTKVPSRIVQLYDKQRAFETSKKELYSSWNYAYSRFSNNLEDIFVLPWHIHLLSGITVAMGTIAIIKTYSSLFKGPVYESEATPSQVDKNAMLDESGGVKPCKVRSRVFPDSWNVISGDVPIHTSDLSSLYNKVNRNVRLAEIIYKGVRRTTHILGLKGNVAIVNTHAIMNAEDFVLSVRVSNSNPASYRDSHITRKDMLRLDNDCTLVVLSGFTFTDILKHCKVLPQVHIAKGYYNGSEVMVQQFRNQKQVVKDPRMSSFVINNFLTIKTKHTRGDCGRPVLIEVQGGCAVVGIHAAGSDTCDTVVVAPIPENLESAYDKVVSQTELLRVSSESRLGFDFKEKVNSKSFINYEEVGNIEMIGSLNIPVTVNNKSKLKKTIFYDHVHEMLYDQMDFISEETYGPPHMKPFKSKGEWISPYNLAIRKMNRRRGYANRSILRRAIKIISDEWECKLRKRGVENLHPITLQEAINGAAEDYYMRRIDLSKGAGFGFPGKKKAHFTEVFPGNYSPSDELMDKIIQRKERYSRGESCPIVFTGMPKDEPREVRKIQKGKTRLFYAGMLDSLVVAKQYLSPFYTLMSQFRYDFGCALGVDPHRESDDIVDHLMEAFCGDEDFLLEGDYAGFDVSMCPDITWAAYTIICNILQRFGYNAFAMLMVRGLLSDFMNPYILILGDIIKVMITPSGKYGTAEDNSVKGVVIVVYLFIADERSKNKNPFRVLRILVYGDDMLCGVKTDCRWFDCFNFAKKCKELLGMEFTSALKGEHNAPFISILEASFLRRRFVQRGNHFVMPLTMNSAEKTIGWLLPSNAASEVDQLSSAFNSFMREVYLTVDKERFDKIRLWGLKLLKSNYGSFDFNIQTHDEITLSLYADKFTSESMTVTEEEQYDINDRLDKFFSDELSMDALCRERPVVYTVLLRLFVAKLSGVEVSRLPEICNWPAAFKYYIIGEIQSLENELKELESHAPEMGDLVNMSRSEIVSLSRYGTDREYREFCDMCLDYRGKKDGIELAIMTLRRAMLRHQSFTSESAEGYIKADGGIEEIKTENLGDMAGSHLDVMNSIKSDYVDVGQSVPLSIENFLKRPVRIAAYSNSPSVVLDEAINPWDAFLSQPSVRAKLRNTAYLRANLHVRIAVSGMPFHFGRYLFSYLPFPSQNRPWQYLLSNLSFTGAPFAELVYLSQSPYARTCDVTANEPLEMVIPYLSPQPVIRLYNDSTSVLAAASSYSDAASLGTLYFKSINTLKSTTATSTPVSIAVYAWLEDVEFGSPTATQLEVTTESDERIDGPISKSTKSMSEAAWALKDVPVIGSYAKASGQVLQGISDAASAMGWSYPTLIDEPMRMKNEPFQNAAVSIGMDTGKRITLDPKQELSVDPRHSGAEEDEMNIVSITSRESLLDTFTWTASATSLSGPLQIIGVHPICANGMANGITPGSKEWIVNTPLSFAATPFHFWRGEITYRLEFVCSMYHRGKMIIGYEPNIRQHTLIDTVLDTNKNYLTTVDLQETRCVEFTVKWASARPWLKCGPMSEFLTPGSAAIDNFNQFERCNGYIYFTPLTRLQSPDGSDIEVNVYVRSHDMHFNAFDIERVPTSFTAESTLSPCDEKDIIVLNPTSASTDGINQHYFGEEPISFRSYLRRFVRSYSEDYVKGDSILRSVRLFGRSIPPCKPNYGEITQTGAVDPNWLTHMRYCYLSMRGGIRKRILLADTEASSASPVLVFLKYEDELTATSITASAFIGYFPQTGGVMFIPQTNSGIEFEIPFYSTNTWGFAQNENYFPSNSLVERKSNYKYELNYGLGGPPRTAKIIEYSAIGEDFNLCNFIAAPAAVVLTVV